MRDELIYGYKDEQVVNIMSIYHNNSNRFSLMASDLSIHRLLALIMVPHTYFDLWDKPKNSMKLISCSHLICDIIESVCISCRLVIMVDPTAHK